MKKTVVFLAVLTALCALSISALAQTEVTFWTLSTRQDAVGPIVEAFNAANPDIKVTPRFLMSTGLKTPAKSPRPPERSPACGSTGAGAWEGFTRKTD